MMFRQHADIVIIGAGVCGALIAQRFAKHSSVVILEAGESGPPRSTLVGNYVTAQKKTMGAPYKGTDAERWVPSPDGPEDSYYVQALPMFKATYTRRVGGSTWHWRGNVPRFVPNDFRLYSEYQVGTDWPITYDDLELHYGEAEFELGVSGNHSEWNNFKGAYRTKGFPMSEIWSSYGDLQVKDAIDTIVVDDVALKVMNTPQARNSQPFDGRPPCAGNSTCDPICPIGAKYDGTVHVTKAVSVGAELYEQCVASKLHVDSSGRIESVDFIKWPEKSKHTIRAKVVIVAAHAIESPKLLLSSRDSRFPSGVSNSSDLVGRCLMDHLQGQAGAILPFPVYPFRGPPTISGIDAFRDGAFRRIHSAFRMSIGNDGWGLVQGPYETLRSILENEPGTPFLFGSGLRDTLRNRIACQFRVSYSTETLPELHNRVEPSFENLDELGLPKPKITFRPSEYQLEAFEVGRKVIRKIFERLGVPEHNMHFQSDLKAYSSANHVIGTCRMGTNSKTSVVNSHCQSHDHPNLFIVGASVFPTAGTANPTLTAIAILLRSLPAIEKALKGVCQ